MQHVMIASPANQHLGYRTLITTGDTLIGSIRFGNGWLLM
jgi:hypothetical protein